MLARGSVRCPAASEAATRASGLLVPPAAASSGGTVTRSWGAAMQRAMLRGGEDEHVRWGPMAWRLHMQHGRAAPELPACTATHKT